MAPLDPHSYAISSQPLITRIDFDLFVDFDANRISGSAAYTLGHDFCGDLLLDLGDIHVHSVVETFTGQPMGYLISKPDAIKASCFGVDFGRPSANFTVFFTTSPQASALQWLEPSQTSGGKLPYVYTQCQAIHARSVFPCQDTPSARFKYSARINVPQEMRAVMSAGHVKRLVHEDEPEKIAPGRAVEVFSMEQPIPPYLFALAVGDLVYEDLGSRSRVYAEPSVVKTAAYEFAETEAMIKQAESLFGPYDWERFDLLVLPPSFPYGGMENPRMVFLTPTVIVGDRSGVGVVAHELAHSWTGNLITNLSANDFWLNEGFTTYAERRIIEVLYGKERVDLHLGLGWNGLEEEMQRFKDRPEFTKLKTNQENVDPDEVYSQVPYEKGCFFVRRLEAEYSRPVFDEFLKSYISTFRFTSIDTETFVEFLKKQFPDIESRVDLDTWLYQPGIPPDAVKPKSSILDTVLSFVDRFLQQQKLYESEGNAFQGEAWNNYLKDLKQETVQWQALEWQFFLESLPHKVSCEALRDLDSGFRFSNSNNWEIRVAFLVLAAYSGFQPCYSDIENALLLVGRMKYLRPLYTGLLDSNGGAAAKELAVKVYAKARSKYHPIARSVVEGLMKKHVA